MTVYILAVLYGVGMLISWPVFYKLTVSGEMSFDENPCETYHEALLDSFLASTVWFVFLFGWFLFSGKKIEREDDFNERHDGCYQPEKSELDDNNPPHEDSESE